MAAMPVEQMHQWARKNQQVWKCAVQMRAMLSNQKETADRKKADQYPFRPA